MIALLHGFLQIVILITIADVILSYLPDVRSQQWAQSIRKVAEIPQRPIRQYLPEGLPLDPAPLLVIIVCRIFISIT